MNQPGTNSSSPDLRRLDEPRGDSPKAEWAAGDVPVSVVMISLNEAHNLEAALENLSGWAHEVFLVDSYSKDRTIDIALRYGVHVVQRRFDGFGSQWNFALETLPIAAPWTMKLDPDERLNSELKSSIRNAIATDAADAISVERRLWFMDRELPISQRMVRVWRTGSCRFSDVLVNEHPIVTGRIFRAEGILEHRDSPDLHHWFEKQNAYTTLEAVSAFEGRPLAAKASLFGNSLQRRMWLKKNFRRIPFRFQLLFLYHLLLQGTWRAGTVGILWARLRADVMRFREYKRYEFARMGKVPAARPSGAGEPDDRVAQY